MNIYGSLHRVHNSLMYYKFPYHSVSVIHRPQDLGFHVFIMENERERVTEDVKFMLSIEGFNYSFVKC